MSAWSRRVAPSFPLAASGRVEARPIELRTIHLHKKHYDAIITGDKVTTVRWNQSMAIGVATFVFDNHPTAPPLAGAVTAVHQYRIDTLTAEQAQQPPGTDIHRFGQQLRENYYPDKPDDAVVEVAELTVRLAR